MVDFYVTKIYAQLLHVSPRWDTGERNEHISEVPGLKWQLDQHIAAVGTGGERFPFTARYLVNVTVKMIVTAEQNPNSTARN